MEVKTVKLSEIKPYWRNPRNNDAAVGAVVKSIQTYGMNQPIIVDADMVIIAGHTRFKALQVLSVSTVPVVIKTDLTPKQVKEYRIADNKTSELASWDMDKLIPELREIDTVSMQAYFPTISLEELLQNTAGAANFADPTQAQIDKVQGQLSTEFSNRNDEKQSAYVEVICPHCGDSFNVDKYEIARSRDE